jgi:hypothetical protein
LHSSSDVRSRVGNNYDENVVFDELRVIVHELYVCEYGLRLGLISWIRMGLIRQILDTLEKQNSRSAETGVASMPTRLAEISQKE